MRRSDALDQRLERGCKFHPALELSVLAALAHERAADRLTAALDLERKADQARALAKCNRLKANKKKACVRKVNRKFKGTAKR